MISRKERTSSEVSDWLEKEGAGRAQIEGIIVRLESLDLIDDERFAMLFAEGKRDHAGWGAERIEEALIGRGIEPALARDAAASGELDDLQRAIQLLDERDHDLEDPSARQRALGLLARRGFSADDAYEAIRLARKRAA
ncbi:MAG: regulatory protein RecX [Solirubrobacterales bacterium]